jgi:dATP pyrophosphohydrolase
LRDAHVQRVFPILPAWRARYSPDVDSNTEHLWYLEVPEVCAVRFEPAEHVAYLWLPVDAAIEKVASWTNREALQRLKDLRGA